MNFRTWLPMSRAAKRGPPTSELSTPSWRSMPASRRPAEWAPLRLMILGSAQRARFDLGCELVPRRAVALRGMRGAGHGGRKLTFQEIEPQHARRPALGKLGTAG